MSRPPTERTGTSPLLHAGAGLIGATTIEQVLQRLRPLFESVIDDRRVNQSGVMYLVIMDPSAQVQAGGFDAAILAEQGFGKPRGAWDFDYAAAAREKARISWLWQRDSHALQTLEPHRLGHGQSLLWGSVALDGIVVAVSGAIPEYDEALAGCVAMLIRAEAKREAHRHREAGALRLST